MYQADLYTQFNDLQRRDVKKVLGNSLKLMRWGKDAMDTIVDLGCGSGDMTRGVLLQHIPACKRIVGMDISSEMLDYAKVRNAHAQIEYVQMDLSRKEVLPAKYDAQFDHAFAFHVFHWIKNQKQLFCNIFDMLKAGGDLLSLFVLQTDLMVLYEQLAMTRKWSPFMRNVHDVFPYQNCADPLKTLETIVEQAGFSHVIKVEKSYFMYDTIDDFKVSMAVIMPFMKNIPVEDHDEFMNDFLQFAADLNFFSNPIATNGKVFLPYDLAVLYARKPDW